MKELSIEEKAKAYDKALAMARKLYNMRGDWTNIEIEAIFPELKESEDERIRKEIIESIKGQMVVVHPEKCIAWLEKQGEQKPADKVEPKFKVGDWIVTDKNHIWLINEDCSTTGYLYRLVSQNGKVEVGDYNIIDEHAHLWTIQDAKDGDVLFTSSTASHETFIFKSIDEKGNIECYFAYDSEDGFREGKYHFIGKPTFKTKPATKEQCNLLFQKMKEAGYKWDAEKKELKKIEQKPAWCEEDERNIDWLITVCERIHYKSDPQVNPEAALMLRDWLKSLRHQSHWKPSEEQMHTLEAVIADYAEQGLSYTKDSLNDLYEQLKKLKG